MDKEKLKHYLTHEMKMSAEDADKALSSMGDEKLSKLASEVDEHDKRMAAESGESTEGDKDEEKKKAEKLAAAKSAAVQLMKTAKTELAGAKLAARKATISARLAGLKAQAKITPAELKKIDIAKLAGSNDVTVEAVLESFQKREPVILVGSFASAKAVDLSKMKKKIEMSALMSETAARFASLSDDAKKEAVKEMGGMDPMPHKESVVNAAGETVHHEPDGDEAYEAEHLAHVAKCYGMMREAMDSGDHETAMKHLSDYMKKMRHATMSVDEMPHKESVVNATESAKHMSQLQSTVEKLTVLLSQALNIDETEVK